ncbi:hypothetical protein GCM10007276_10700 [Agaricicola taiwanensis]|uniref:WbqC family protein n=1 Tax=Agaricicola taiwanensis TaxID=591372 RepID=A0A8J2VL22_9RHOB|nr:WbqC family protein [Agaricicola taiwanensis]GGE35065.1 hypothetical protein GCM10007276_10700 [Agaricicola taiwanensis]
MTIVGIHQPNHLPWLGYFAKIARSDIFVFLDDAQYPKGSYVNRVKIAESDTPAWLTVPVRVSLGDNISSVVPSRANWHTAHRDRLLQCYRKATFFRETWPEVETWLAETPSSTLAQANVFLIERIAFRLGLTRQFRFSSELALPPAASDERLAEIVHSLAPGGVYLSGSGGANYQSAETFQRYGLTLQYSSFQPQSYDRSGNPFLAGLSVLDAIFHCGWDATARLVTASR